MMRLSEKIRVEPLDADRVARLEQRVLASFDGLGEVPVLGARRPFRWLVPAVAIAGVAVAVLVNLRAATTEAPLPVVVGQHGPTQIVTGSEATRIVVGRATIEVAANSDVDVTRTADGGVAVAIATGRVDCEVEPYAERPPFLVRAGGVKVTVVGTIFSVETRPASKLAVQVAVTRGRVRVDTAAGVATYVVAGHRWTDARGVVASAAAKPGGHGTAATASATAKPRTVAIDTRHRARLRKRTSRVPTARRGNRRAAKTPHKRETNPPKPAAAPTLSQELRTSRVSMAPLLELSVTGTRNAAAEYRSISVTGRGKRAAHALYSLAHIQLLRLGDRHGALKTIGFYQRRFGRGKHARDVQWLRVRALCDRVVGQNCRSAAHAYLNRFGASGDRARLASRIIGWGM